MRDGEGVLPQSPPDGRETPTGPLSGIRVLDLSTMISGPIATRMLGDQGADVIKVEAPGGGDLVRHMGARREGLSATFVTSNRNKRSIVLDLKQAAGREALLRLVDRSDVFVQNFRPGAIERLGLGEAALRERKPDLIYVSISGFGDTGPYTHKRVYDPVIQALSGLASIQADRETGRPRMVRTIVPDKVTSLTAAQAITAALFQRATTGRGSHVQLSMLDAVVAFLWPEGMTRLTFRSSGSPRADRVQLAQDLIFETGDGYITAGAVSDAEWRGMCEALERPTWLEDERFETAQGRVIHVAARLKMTAEVLATRSSAEWLERLDAHGVPCAPVLALDEVPGHAQIQANGTVVQREHPVAGAMQEPRPAARFDGEAPLGAAAPVLGQHTDEILAEAGLDAGEISALRAAGVLGGGAAA